ncbi:ATP-binding cassette-type vacuolar membrane transporter Hmt1 [Coemansia sp. RSA 988]|nr:ATP-binding cassette-type vacuolar membrane transporter Hmt1 [Coemansia sp. RSA 988]
MSPSVIVASASDVERQPLSPVFSRDSAAADCDTCSLSQSPTALNISHTDNQPDPAFAARSSTKPACNSTLASSQAASATQSRIETLQQVCNGMTWLVAAESLVHTMLVFALRQELTRNKRPDPQAIHATSWLAFAQICTAASWVLQLRHRYASPKRKSAAAQKTSNVPICSWTPRRECFWMLALIASIYELYAYIACSPLPSQKSGVQVPLGNTMLRVLISIRIVLNSVLVVCAAHGAYLQGHYRRALLAISQRQQAEQYRLQQQYQQEQYERRREQEQQQRWTRDTLISHPVAGDPTGHCANKRHHGLEGADDVAFENTERDVCYCDGGEHQMQPPPQRPLTGQELGSYGATVCNTFHTSPSTTSTVSQRSKVSTETTPLVASPREDAENPQHTHQHQHQHQHTADQTEADEVEPAYADNALSSGAKKVKMYHQSDDLSHDIMGLRRRLGLLAPFLWPSGDRILQLRIFCCLLILIAGRIVNVLVPLQFKAVVDGLSPKDGSAPKFEWANVLIYTGLQTLQGSVGVLSTLQSFAWIPVGQATTKRISVAMFDHLHQLSLRFHVGRKTGEILRVQDRGVMSVVSLLRSIIFNVIPTLADIALACYFFSVMFDLYFGTIVFTTMMSYLTITILLTGWRTRYRRRSNYLDNEMEARAVDSLLNFETVKYYNAETFEGKEYEKAVEEFQHAEWFSNASMNLMNMGQNLIVQVGLLAGALLSAKRVYEGQMTVGDFTMLLSYIAQLYGPLNWFGTYYRIIQKNFIDMEKLLELFDEPVEVKDPIAPARLEVPRGEVVFDNVSFSYDKQPTLKNVSFKVPAGSTVAIVGPSGSGKSTILRLLFRFYDVQSGRIMIDGQDIRSVRQTDLRQTIGNVPQDTVLFNDSIRYNIAYGRAGSRSGVAMKEVTNAADAAHIHSHIMGFAEQYETRVGERGQRLSGGEKQRVAIARTLLKDPRIVCLDEATSALDTATERQIQASLREMTQNRTTLIIAHRLSTVIHADQILIVQNGEIVERGTHTELISDCSSVYYDMWMKQLTDAANASYNPYLDVPNIQLPMPGTMTPEPPAGSHSSPNGSPPEQDPQPPDSIQRPCLFERRGLNYQQPPYSSAPGEAARRARDHLHLALDGPLIPRMMMSQGWTTYGSLTAPLPSSVNQSNMLCTTTGLPAASSSSSLSAAEPDGLHMDIGHAGLPVSGATGDLMNDINQSPFDMSYEDMLRIRQQQDQKQQ